LLKFAPFKKGSKKVQKVNPLILTVKSVKTGGLRDILAKRSIIEQILSNLPSGTLDSKLRT
jgi:hypothetical protein